MRTDTNIVGRTVEVSADYAGDEIKAVCVSIQKSTGKRFVEGYGEGRYRYFLNGAQITATVAGVLDRQSEKGRAFRYLRNVARREYIAEFVR